MKTSNKTIKLQCLTIALTLGLAVNTVCAQKKLAADTLKFHNKIAKYILPCSTMFVSGLLDGTIETISYHYSDGFKRVFPNANDEYWNPAVSWTNKYKDNNPTMGPKFTGSTTLFAATTDAYHGLRTLRNFTDVFTVSFYINRSCHKNNRPTFGKIIMDALIFAAIRDIGFSATYSLLFREDNHK
jgi:hypothetical protein